MTVPDLSIGRAYTASDAAAILGMSKSTFNERVREGRIRPVFDDGERRFSGYMLAKLLGWPLTDDPRDYMPGGPPMRGPARVLAERVRTRRPRPEDVYRADAMDFPPNFENGPAPFGEDYQMYRCSECGALVRSMKTAASHMRLTCPNAVFTRELK